MPVDSTLERIANETFRKIFEVFEVYDTEQM